ncbi:SET domain-containing protein [Hyaloscypha hepaticicola]|uniref:SET domain-containing protein n=1 Tax=Hyaloscypha hepaticicola TaxID=2082293 RepID=A0A2J6Q4A3_9HELO|nr:SET domain-containing protein [Hyaloscypha hepaticicola]
MAPSRTTEPDSPPNGTESPTSNPETSLWSIAPIPGKGLGLIANQDIIPGTLILSEAPLLTTEGVTTIDLEVAESQLRKKLSSLPPSSQKAFMGLHNNYPDDKPLSGIVRSNGYPMGPGAEAGGVYETISRINHSCAPNVVQAWNPLAEKETVFAVRNIPAGTEICTAYHVGGPSSERKKILKMYFGFDCTCALCSLPEEQLKKGDERMVEAEELDETIGDSKKVRFHAAEVLACCHQLARIYEEEGVKDDRLSRLYFDCFQVCNMHGDLARARVFAKQYCSAKKMAAGEDCIGLLEMKPFVKNPQKHESFGVTDDWKTKAESMPKGLGRREFERWLWREQA